MSECLVCGDDVSIRFVKQTHYEVQEIKENEQIGEYCEDQFGQIGSRNQYEFYCGEGCLIQNLLVRKNLAEAHLRSVDDDYHFTGEEL